MADIKTVFLLIVVAGLNIAIAVKEREDGDKGEVQNSNEYDLKTILNYLQDSKEKKVKTSVNENEEHRIKIKGKENGERKIKVREPRDHHKKEASSNLGNSKSTYLRRHRQRGFTKITPTVGVYATPKITSIKKWKNKNKESKYPRSAEDEDVSKSYPEEDKDESKTTTKPRERRRKGKGKKSKLNKEYRRSSERRNNYNSNDLVISKEINMTKSFQSDQPVDIIVHIKMKN